MYFSHYFELAPADFHAEMFDNLSNWSIKFIDITGFRGCAKSSIAATMLVIYAALEGKAKFIVPINETDDVGKLTLDAIRTELETNEFLIADYGIGLKKERGTTKFSETTIVLSNGCRIMARSRGQKFRGLKHRQSRPDLVLMDDVEEREKVDTKEYRDKTYTWVMTDVIPGITNNRGRLIVLGNMLHVDALMARLSKHKSFVHARYPLVDDNGHCTWSAAYPTEAALRTKEQEVGRASWLREYLLKVVPPEGQEVKEEWINYYDELPASPTMAGAGVDFAISKKQTADYTTMVSGVAKMDNGRPKIYILPNPVNARLSFHETKETAYNLFTSLRSYSDNIMFFPEDVAYQKAAIEEFSRMLIPVTPMRPGGDKRSRLRTAATFIQNGTVQFPRHGCDDLITQILGFGVEDHDDLVDGLVNLILGITKVGIAGPQFLVL